LLNHFKLIVSGKPHYQKPVDCLSVKGN